ncbi:LOW QUALITY PROTEIN: TP53TG3C isoform 1, partial [Pongo abelii]
RRAPPCVPQSCAHPQPRATWCGRPSTLRPCPALSRIGAVSPYGKPGCSQISPAGETVELGWLVSPYNCDMPFPRAKDGGCQVRSLISHTSTKGKSPLRACAAGFPCFSD